MHLVVSALFAEVSLCVGGAAFMGYWAWKAVPVPSEPDIEFGDSVKQVYQRPALPVESLRYSLLKRAIDIAFAMAMLSVFIIPGCLIALLIVTTSPGPVFYREKRIGRYGYLFRIWKFRSMYKNAEQRSVISQENAGETQLFWRMRKSSSDPRITRIGHFLRKWSLDELPQILNILLGDMSLIGPRPIIEAEIGAYGPYIENYVEATPGLSGLWQVSGRSNIGYHGRAELDAQYIRNWSIRQDIKILLRTVPAVLRRVGAK